MVDPRSLRPSVCRALLYTSAGVRVGFLVILSSILVGISTPFQTVVYWSGVGLGAGAGISALSLLIRASLYTFCISQYSLKQLLTVLIVLNVLLATIAMATYELRNIAIAILCILYLGYVTVTSLSVPHYRELQKELEK